jgi:hypothetical protein
MKRGYVLAPEAALDLVQIWLTSRGMRALKSPIALNRRFAAKLPFWQARQAPDTGGWN